MEFVQPVDGELEQLRLRAHGVLLGESEAVVQEPTFASRNDRVAVDELPLAQKRQVVGGDEPGTFEETRG